MNAEDKGRSFGTMSQQLSGEGRVEGMWV